MDEIEMRLAAVELVMLELAAEVDPGARARAARRIREGVAGAAGDEAAVRDQALQALAEADRRFDVFTAPGGRRLS